MFIKDTIKRVIRQATERGKTLAMHIYLHTQQKTLPEIHKEQLHINNEKTHQWKNEFGLLTSTSQIIYPNDLFTYHLH